MRLYYRLFFRRAGFTLVELLVVMAIVGLLASLLFPAMQSSLMSARRAACASNMRQLGLGFMLYAAVHDGQLPPTSHSTGGNAAGAWIALLKPYIGNTDAIRVCPSDPLRRERAIAGATSYILNNIVFDPLYDPFGGSSRAYNNLYQLSNPSRTLLAGIVSDARPGISPLNDHTHAESWDRGWRVVINDIEPNRHRVGPSNEEKTNGSSNYLFADGRVEAMDAQFLKQQFDQGNNIAWPPE